MWTCLRQSDSVPESVDQVSREVSIDTDLNEISMIDSIIDCNCFTKITFITTFNATNNEIKATSVL